jgi:hypothetical protein
VNIGQVPDADGAAGDAGQPRCLGGCALLPGPLGPLSRDCPGSAALCTDWLVKLILLTLGLVSSLLKVIIGILALARLN